VSVHLAIGDASERVARSCSLADGVTRLRYVSGGRGEALERLGLSTVRDVLLHVPHRYLDFTRVLPISHADVGQGATVIATVDDVKLKRPRRNMQIVELWVLDATGVLVATFFKQPWIANQVAKGDVVALSGKVTFDYGYKRMKAPFMEVLGQDGQDASTYARVLPVHPVGKGITAAIMRRIISGALTDVGDVCDPVPARIVAGRHLMTLSRALRCVHFPSSLEEGSVARRRLAYDELLCLQLALLARQAMDADGVEAHQHVTDGPHVAALAAALPFSLTDEQQTCVEQILADMAATRVMNRLLLGDVGTGKTVVAAMAVAACADTGTQAAVMAPTSVLAGQYAQKLGPLLDAAGITWALVTGATGADARAEAEEGVASGRICCVFGTTAILSEGIEPRDLSLVVIDEQHRFGVNQRAALRSKGAGADMLAMTATPIPRTLALSIYGDLAISRITRRPRAGAGVETKVVADRNLDIAWGAIRDAVEAHHQAYVVCPLVSDTDDGSELDDVPEAMRSAASRLHSATSTAEELARSTFADLRVDLLTGRMTAAQKDEAMARFRAGETDVLVSTTVIEVGVDVPNATAMLVLDADRFGLATLHQLRGRVGRGDVSGVVYLHSMAKRGSVARQRLAALERTSDGFELAELDLTLRHEGEVLGYRQHGGAQLKIADLVADADLVEAAHEDALAIVAADPGLASPEHAPLAIEVRDRFGGYFEELDRA